MSQAQQETNQPHYEIPSQNKGTSTRERCWRLIQRIATKIKLEEAEK